jgi:drug/metabolite transporter (DMT)-like permease
MDGAGDRRASVSMSIDAKTTAARMTTADWGVLGLCAVLWGSAYSFNKITLAELPPLVVTAVRLVLAAATMFLIAHLTGTRIPPLGPAWRPFFVFTLMSNVVPFLLVLYGQRSTPSGLAAVLVTTTPLFLLVIAYLTGHERLEARRLFGVLMGIAGVAIAVGGELLDGLSEAFAAKLALVAAALLYAIGALYSKRLMAHDPVVISTLQMSAGAILTVPLMLVFEPPWTLAAPSPRAIAALAATAVFGSALASYTYFQVFRRAGPVNAMLVTLLVPVTPLLLGVVFLGERLNLREVTGAAVIAAALVIIDGRMVAWLRRRLGWDQA